MLRVSPQMIVPDGAAGSEAVCINRRGGLTLGGGHDDGVGRAGGSRHDWRCLGAGLRLTRSGATGLARTRARQPQRRAGAAGWRMGAIMASALSALPPPGIAGEEGGAAPCGCAAISAASCTWPSRDHAGGTRGVERAPRSARCRGARHRRARPRSCFSGLPSEGMCTVRPFGKILTSCWRAMLGQCRTSPTSMCTKGEPEVG